MIGGKAPISLRLPPWVPDDEYGNILPLPRLGLGSGSNNVTILSHGIIVISNLFFAYSMMFLRHASAPTHPL
jgi:hypothetical protein